MSRPWFSRRRDGRVAVQLDPSAVAMLSGVFAEVLVLLEEAGEEPADPLAAELGIGSATEPPEDPALRRLLPDAYADDQDAASEFRRYTELGLRERKRIGARAVVEGLAGPFPLVLDRAAVLVWLAALNDARLALGTRLEIEEDWTERLDAIAPDDPVRYAYWVYEYLTEMQERLVQAAGEPTTGRRSSRG